MLESEYQDILTRLSRLTETLHNDVDQTPAVLDAIGQVADLRILVRQAHHTVRP